MNDLRRKSPRTSHMNGRQGRYPRRPLQGEPGRASRDRASSAAAVADKGTDRTRAFGWRMFPPDGTGPAELAALNALGMHTTRSGRQSPPFHAARRFTAQHRLHDSSPRLPRSISWAQPRRSQGCERVRYDRVRSTQAGAFFSVFGGSATARAPDRVSLEHAGHLASQRRIHLALLTSITDMQIVARALEAECARSVDPNRGKTRGHSLTDTFDGMLECR